jgi:hypothetical protein
VFLLFNQALNTRNEVLHEVGHLAEDSDRANRSLKRPIARSARSWSHLLYSHTNLLSNICVGVIEELLHLRSTVTCHGVRRDVAKGAESQSNHILVSMSQIPTIQYGRLRKPLKMSPPKRVSADSKNRLKQSSLYFGFGKQFFC